MINRKNIKDFMLNFVFSSMNAANFVLAILLAPRAGFIITFTTVTAIGLIIGIIKGMLNKAEA